MKKLLLSLLTTAAFAVALPASANVVTTLHETLASGATFTGELTFADNYQSLLDVDGVLTGGGYGTLNFSWTWSAGNGSQSIDQDGIAATLEDWLMDGDSVNTYEHYLGLSWVAGASDLTLKLVPATSIYYAGLNRVDAVVSASASSVPEPGSLALLGLGGLALAALRRHRA